MQPHPSKTSQLSFYLKFLYYWMLFLRIFSSIKEEVALCFSTANIEAEKIKSVVRYPCKCSIQKKCFWTNSSSSKAKTPVSFTPSLSPCLNFKVCFWTIQNASMNNNRELLFYTKLNKEIKLKKPYANAL